MRRKSDDLVPVRTAGMYRARSLALERVALGRRRLAASRMQLRASFRTTASSPGALVGAFLGGFVLERVQVRRDRAQARGRVRRALAKALLFSRSIQYLRDWLH